MLSSVIFLQPQRSKNSRLWNAKWINFVRCIRDRDRSLKAWSGRSASAYRFRFMSLGKFWAINLKGLSVNFGNLVIFYKLYLFIAYKVIYLRAVFTESGYCRVWKIFATTDIDIFQYFASDSQLFHCEICDPTVPIELYIFSNVTLSYLSFSVQGITWLRA